MHRDGEEEEEEEEEEEKVEKTRNDGSIYGDEY
jgi:hypothetical protein